MDCRTQNDQGLLLRIGLGLVLGIATLIDGVADPTKETQNGKICDSPKPPENAEPSLPRLGRERRRR